jgi:hypothetical protein
VAAVQDSPVRIDALPVAEDEEWHALLISERVASMTGSARGCV